MNSMMLGVDVASVDLDNAANRLQRLQQTQFIENRVQEEDVTVTHPEIDKKIVNEKSLTDVEATKIVMNDSLKMLNKCYKKLSLEDEEDEDSDSEDQCLRHIYKPINPYDKRTPYIICTKEWLEKWHIGLKDDSDNEEEPEEHEIPNDDEEESPSETFLSQKHEENDEFSNNESPDHIIHVQVPNVTSHLPEILERGHLVLPVAPVVTPKVTPEPNFFRNQTQSNVKPQIPSHFTQNFFDNEPPELDNVSVGNRSSQVPNLFTESDDENENFIKSTPEKPVPELKTPKNSNVFGSEVKPIDEPDRISIISPAKKTQEEEKLDKNLLDNSKKVTNTNKSLLNSSKVSNLFESDTDDDEDYFDIIRKSNRKSANKPPNEGMSVNLVKEDSPKIVENSEKSENLNSLVKENTVKNVQKKAKNLFEDSDEDDDFFKIKPKVSETPKTSVIPSEKRSDPEKTVPTHVSNESPVKSAQIRSNERKIRDSGSEKLRDPVTVTHENFQESRVKVSQALGQGLQHQKMASKVENKDQLEREPFKKEEKRPNAFQSTPNKQNRSLFDDSDEENDLFVPNTSKSKLHEPVHERKDPTSNASPIVENVEKSVKSASDQSKMAKGTDSKRLFGSSDDENDIFVPKINKSKLEEPLHAKNDEISASKVDKSDREIIPIDKNDRDIVPIDKTAKNNDHTLNLEKKDRSKTFFGSSDDENDFLVPSKSKRKESLKEKKEVILTFDASTIIKNVEKSGTDVDTGDQTQSPFIKTVESEVNSSDLAKNDHSHSKTLFGSSESDENDFILPKTANVSTLVKSSILNVDPHLDASQKASEDLRTQIPEKNDLPSDAFSLPPEDTTSSELFSPQSDSFFTPTDTTPNTTATPVYQSFIDELPPDDDFSNTYDTNNEFDTGYNPEENENFEQNNVATDPFLFTDEPPEDLPIPTTPVKIVKEEKKLETNQSPDTFKNKFKMFESGDDSQKSPPKIEKPNKPVPKKLNVNLNINVSALLPGAKRPSPKMSDESNETTNPSKKIDEVSVIQEPVVNTTPKKDERVETQSNLLVSMNKNRVRAPSTRKPSTRKGRVQSYHESMKKDDVVPNDDVKTDFKVPPMSVAEMLRTEKMKDQLSRRSLNFDEVDELSVNKKQTVPVEKVIVDEKKLEPTIVEHPKVTTPKKTPPTKTSPNRKPILFDDEEEEEMFVPPKPPSQETLKKVRVSPPSQEIFKKVEIKRDLSKNLEKPNLKTAIFESDESDEELFVPKTKSTKKVEEVVKPKSKAITSQPPKLPKLFDDDSEDDDDLFSAKSSVKRPRQETVSSSQKDTITSTKTNTKHKSKSLFGSDDEDDDLFGSKQSSKIVKTVSTKVSKPQKSLFGDESGDDDSLFGSSSSKGEISLFS